MPSRSRWAAAPNSKRITQAWRRHKTTEFFLKKFGKGNGRPVLKIRPDNLNSYRKSIWRNLDWHRSYWQTARGGGVRPYKAGIEIRACLAIDLDVPGLDRQGMIVAKGGN